MKKHIQFFLKQNSSTPSIFKQAFCVKEKFNLRALLIIALFFAIAFYPSDISWYRARQKDKSPHVIIIENGLRYVPTVLQFAVPILFADKIGLIQATYVAVGTTITTQGLKRIMNNWSSYTIRLGERPFDEGSRFNMPSGHTTMAASAVFFLLFRYGIWHLSYSMPLLILTMYARIMLKAHTLSAVFAGSVLAFLIASLLTSRFAKSKLK
jgi:membrane-associated phospholipid phosphatase